MGADFCSEQVKSSGNLFTGKRSRAAEEHLSGEPGKTAHRFRFLLNSSTVKHKVQMCHRNSQILLII
jgi:hypothetical protein